MFIINLLGIALGIWVVSIFEDYFKDSRCVIKGNLDLVEVSYIVVVLSIIGNILFVSPLHPHMDPYQFIGGLASCVVNPFLAWALEKKYGKPCKNLCG